MITSQHRARRERRGSFALGREAGVGGEEAKKGKGTFSKVRRRSLLCKTAVGQRLGQSVQFCPAHFEKEIL